MKGLVITNKIHTGSREHKMLENLKPVDILDLRRCTFASSPALEIIKKHPDCKKMLSDELVELIGRSEG